MQDPVQRVLTVLEILQARDSVAGAELARRLEVDVRTVQRYIARLKDLGIPVESSRGVGGAYRLRPGARLPPLLLNNEEAFALALGLRGLHSVGLAAFAPAAADTLAKLARLLPDTLRESLRTVQEVIAVEPGPWVVPAAVESLIGAATAIRAGRRLRFGYQSHHGAVSQRQIEPYAVLYVDGRWYLIGYCLTRRALRTFRLDRTSGLQVTSSHFRRPRDFDARRHLRESMPFVQSAFHVDVWMNLPFEEAERLFAPWRIACEPESGGTRLRCNRDHLEQLAAMLLSAGCRLRVRHPPELRTTFRALARLASAAANGDEAHPANEYEQIPEESGNRQPQHPHLAGAGEGVNRTHHDDRQTGGGQRRQPRPDAQRRRQNQADRAQKLTQSQKREKQRRMTAQHPRRHRQLRPAGV